MEEVDHIILQTLNQLGVPVPEDVVTLVDFPEALVLPAAARCLSNIAGRPYELPDAQPVSQKIMIATKMVAMCKKLGFKGDLGYQLFLYPNENDLRKIFMFLIEKLPKESEKNDIPVAREGLSLLMHDIGLKVSEGLVAPWIPSAHNCCPWGVSKIPDNFPVKSSLSIEEQTAQANAILEKLKLYGNIDLLVSGNFGGVNTGAPASGALLSGDGATEEIQMSLEEVTAAVLRLQDDTKSIQGEISILKKQKQNIVSQMSEENSEVKLLQDKKDTAQLVRSLLPERETNLDKLKAIGHKEAARIRALEKEIDQKNALAIEREQQKIAHNKQLKVISVLEENLTTISDDYNKKNALRVRLMKQYEKRNVAKKYVKKRSAYTKRIMEIIGNIAKQKLEINKILSDTRLLQKDLNSMNGKLDRSFAVVDELVFKDAKKDLHARKTYKLLAYIHTECGDIVTKVNQIGSDSREIRELQKNVENERKKKITENLERVYLDLKYEQSNAQRGQVENGTDPLQAGGA